MSDIKYQIFVSSTFTDLVEERQLAFKAILDLDHIPSGMEAFPAIDMDQFEYIKKVIDECDYYLLIVGARYGSTDEKGVSYTEREYDYAVAEGKTVIALLHDDIENLPFKKVDGEPQLRKKQDAFRAKVKTGRMVRAWKSHDQLALAITQAIIKAIATYPAVGWIRGDTAASADVMQQYMQLRAEYDKLQSSYQNLRAANSAKLYNLASLTEQFTIHYRHRSPHGQTITEDFETTWGELFKVIGPDLLSPKGPLVIKNNIRRYIVSKKTRHITISVDEMDVDTVKMQFSAMGLLQIRSAQSTTGGIAEFVQLTERGKATLLEQMAVRGVIDAS